MRESLAATSDGLPTLGLRMREVAAQGGATPPTRVVAGRCGRRRAAAPGIFDLAEIEDLLQVVDDPLIRALDLISLIDLVGILACPDGRERCRVLEAIKRVAQCAPVAPDLRESRDDLLLTRRGRHSCSLKCAM